MTEWKNPRWTFGFLLLLILGLLIRGIALNKVTQVESHGLDQLIGGYLVLIGGFAQWAFATLITKGDKDA